MSRRPDSFYLATITSARYHILHQATSADFVEGSCGIFSRSDMESPWATLSTEYRLNAFTALLGIKDLIGSFPEALLH